MREERGISIFKGYIFPWNCDKLAIDKRASCEKGLESAFFLMEESAYTLSGYLFYIDES